MAPYRALSYSLLMSLPAKVFVSLRESVCSAVTLANTLATKATAVRIHSPSIR
ncbi:MAG: hypothetical protein J6T87_00595 [Bacteroidales bacterium]|nr:hypothetical protein [Bacteroidales bacterium]